MITIPRDEIGVTRLFSLSLENSEAAALRDDPDRQAQLLGVQRVNPDKTEVFPLSDLSDLGLVGFLREGLDIEEEALRRDAVKLGALDGWVLMVHSGAVLGSDTALRPAKELTLIGTYGETKDDRPAIDLQAETAQPYTGHPQSTPLSSAAYQRGSAAIVAALAIVLGLALWWVLTSI